MIGYNDGGFHCFRWNEPGDCLAPEARMKVAGGKLGESKRTHRVSWRCVRAPAGRMRLPIWTRIMRPAGARDLISSE